MLIQTIHFEGKSSKELLETIAKYLYDHEKTYFYIDGDITIYNGRREKTLSFEDKARLEQKGQEILNKHWKDDYNFGDMKQACLESPYNLRYTL